MNTVEKYEDNSARSYNFSFFENGPFSNSKFIENDVRAYLDKGYDINTKDRDGRNILHFLASKPYTHEIIFDLVKSGADVSAIDKSGQTPLHFAVKNGIFKNSAVLLKCGSNINCEDKNKDKPLDFLPSARLSHHSFMGNEIKNRDNYLHLDICLQYLPTGENSCKIDKNILDFGESDVTWINKSQKDIIVFEDERGFKSSGSTYSNKDKGTLINQIKSYEPNISIDTFKNNFAKYLLSWGAEAKPDTFNKLLEIEKIYLPVTDKNQKNYAFSLKSFEDKKLELSVKRFNNLVKELSKKNIKVESTENINLSDKISFLSTLYYEKEFLSKKQLDLPKNNTYRSRYSRQSKITDTINIVNSNHRRSNNLTYREQKI